MIKKYGKLVDYARSNSADLTGAAGTSDDMTENVISTESAHCLLAFSYQLRRVRS